MAEHILNWGGGRGGGLQVSALTCRGSRDICKLFFYVFFAVLIFLSDCTVVGQSYFQVLPQKRKQFIVEDIL